MKLVVKVPNESVPNVLGPSGSTLKQLQGITDTKIKLKLDQDFAICQINGHEDNAELAERLILDIIANISPLNKGKNNNVTKENDPRYENLSDTPSETMIQVYVSSIESPSHFWLQLITPKACSLEHLVDDMTEFYSSPKNQKQYRLKKVTTGQIVATKLATDEKWCRAEVCGFKGELNDQNPETMIDLFCVDYGDSSYHTLKHIYEIKPEFLSLRFQAIEVTMSNIVPNNSKEWPDESTSAFESMVFTGEWKVMMAQVTEFKKRKCNKKVCSIPCVRLFDPEGPPGVDISQNLIQRGLAAPAVVPKERANGTITEEKKEKKRMQRPKKAKSEQVEKEEVQEQAKEENLPAVESAKKKANGSRGGTSGNRASERRSKKKNHS